MHMWWKTLCQPCPVKTCQTSALVIFRYFFEHAAPLTSFNTSRLSSFEQCSSAWREMQHCGGGTQQKNWSKADCAQKNWKFTHKSRQSKGHSGWMNGWMGLHREVGWPGISEQGGSREAGSHATHWNAAKFGEQWNSRVTFLDFKMCVFVYRGQE